MKLRTICGLLLAGTSFTAAQGIYEFEGRMTGDQAIPPNNSQEVGEFHFFLVGSDLGGWFGRTTFLPVAGRLEFANGQIFFESSRFFRELPSFETEVGGWIVSPGLSLTEEIRSALVNQQVFATITSQAYPGGELRGRVSLVPEPLTIVIFALGVLSSLPRGKSREELCTNHWRTTEN